jgi:hypothetical protein
VPLVLRCGQEVPYYAPTADVSGPAYSFVLTVCSEKPLHLWIVKQRTVESICNGAALHMYFPKVFIVILNTSVHIQSDQKNQATHSWHMFYLSKNKLH